MREDDLVAPDGTPVSAAHKALYDHVSSVEKQLKEHVDTSLGHHERTVHVDMVNIAKIHAKDRRDLTEIANMALGSPRTELLGGGRNDDGWDHMIRANAIKIDDLHSKFGNGERLKFKLDWKQVVAIAVFAVFTVAKQFGWI